MMDFARAGDVIHVTKTDRLARSTIDALQIARKLEAQSKTLNCSRTTVYRVLAN